MASSRAEFDLAVSETCVSLLERAIEVDKIRGNAVRNDLVREAEQVLVQFGAAPYKALIQNICYHLTGLARADGRNARAALVVDMMVHTSLPQDEYDELVSWLVLLSGGVDDSHHRFIALEIIAKLLLEDRWDSSHGTSRESAAADFELARESAAADSELAQDSAAADSEPEMDVQPADEQEVRRESRTMPLLDALEAVHDRVYDAVNSIRSRSLRALADCARSDRPCLRRAMAATFGDQSWARAMQLATDGLADEGALVRREAVVYLDSLFSLNDTLLNEANLKLLSEACRDVALSVRSAAIQVLGERALLSPTPALLDAFIAGPMDRLGDPETKVAEQVAKFLSEILFDPLRPYRSDEPEVARPWSFLAAVVRSSTRSNLLQGVTMLFKSKAISKRVVPTLASHLQAADETRALHALVLLNCLASHLDCTDLGFLLDFYYGLFDEDRSTECDDRLLQLSFETLSTWSAFLTTEQKAALRAQLIELVRSADLAIANCRPTCVALAAHLDPDNVQWAGDLMRAYAMHAVRDGEVEAAVCAADLSVSAPTPPPVTLVRAMLRWAVAPAALDETAHGRLAAALGRISIPSWTVAAAAAPVLARTLADRNAPLAARHNSMIALTDICQKYASIMEQSLDALCIGLEPDTHLELRRAATRALTRLLRDEFLRLRPPLYYRYCALLVDDQPEVRQMVRHYFGTGMSAEDLFRHLVDCVRHYSAPPGSPAPYTHGLPKESRRRIYDTMLKRLSAGHRTQVQCKLAREVLAPEADRSEQGEELTEHGLAACEDALDLISGPCLRASACADDDDRPAAAVASQKMRRMVAETVVPAALRLYAGLVATAGRGGGMEALRTHLKHFATDLLKDYQLEIEQLSARQEELAELVRDFRSCEGVPAASAPAASAPAASAPAASAPAAVASVGVHNGSSNDSDHDDHTPPPSAPARVPPRATYSGKRSFSKR